MAPSESTPADTLATVNEIAVLERLFPLLPDAEAALLGPGDDAAILRAPDGRYVVTTDLMVHGPDFRSAWSTPNDLGWKATATNLADIAAMGAVPTGLVVALAAPSSTQVSLLEGVAAGLRSACEQLAPGCGVVGGDLSVSDTFMIAVTAFGDLQGRAPVLRSGARVGDVVAIAGALGQAAAGLALLFGRAVDADGHPDALLASALREEEKEVLDAQLRPQPPIAAGPAAARAGATAMLDVSDGLALDARRIANASDVAISLDSDALGPDAETALRGGEDHGLLACFPPEAELPRPFRPLGRVVQGHGLLVDGKPFDERGGWDPYSGWDGAAG